MAAAPIIAIARAQAMLDNFTANLNSGTIKIYTGSAPANLKTAATGTLLSSGCTFNATAFASSTDPGTGNALATANAIVSDTNAANTGTAGYFRGLTSGGTEIIQGTCGTSSADMILNTTSIVAGATVAITSYTISLPNGSSTD